jgi:hypothetical protein
MLAKAVNSGERCSQELIGPRDAYAVAKQHLIIAILGIPNNHVHESDKDGYGIGREPSAFPPPRRSTGEESVALSAVEEEVRIHNIPLSALKTVPLAQACPSAYNTLN